jgi:hypothetical protein
MCSNAKWVAALDLGWHSIVGFLGNPTESAE